MAEATGLGDIVLNGKRYRIDVETWREKDIIDFAPRATVPTGSVVMSDLNLYQPLVQTDWRHGQGFHWYEDAAGYLRTAGNVDTRQDGLAMLMTKATSSDTNNNEKDGMVIFAGDVYSYGAAGVRKYNGTSWSQVNTRFVSVGSSYKAGATGATAVNVANVNVKNALNNLMVVVVHLKSNVSITDVKWKGVSLGAAAGTTGSSAPKTVIYAAPGVDTGTGTVAVTLGSASDVVVTVQLLYSVLQVGSLGTVSVEHIASDTSAAITYSSAAKRIIIDAITLNAATLPTVRAADTLAQQQTQNATMSGSLAYADGAGSVFTGWTWTGATKAEHLAVEVNYLAAETAVSFLLPAGDYLFICPTGGRILKMTAAGVVSDAGLDHNSVDYKWLIIHNGAIYAGKASSNHIHFDTNEDLSQLEGVGTDPNLIHCGVSNISTLRSIVYAGQLYVARQDGLWNLADDHIARRVIDYSQDADGNNFRGMAVLNGYLVFALRDRVIQWNGARVSDITPSKITDIYPYVMYGRFTNFTVSNNFLYCVGRTNQTPYVEDLLCYDGVGWHKLMNIVPSGTNICTMVAYDVLNDRLWFHVVSASDITYYVPFQAQSTFPYADFPTTGTHSLISSRLDMGFRRVRKSMASIIVEARNCSADHYLSVYYQIDGDGTWIKWTDIKQNGIQEFKEPGGFKTREFNYVQLRIDFTTTDNASSPVLEGWTLRFIMRPDTLIGFNFWIVAENEGQYGTSQDERTAVEIRKELLIVRNSKPPVLLIGLEGDEHWGYLTSYQGQPVYRVDMNEEVPDKVEYRFQCNFVEVG